MVELLRSLAGEHVPVLTSLEEGKDVFIDGIRLTEDEVQELRTMRTSR